MRFSSPHLTFAAVIVVSSVFHGSDHSLTQTITQPQISHRFRPLSPSAPVPPSPAKHPLKPPLARTIYGQGMTLLHRDETTDQSSHTLHAPDDFAFRACSIV